MLSRGRQTRRPSLDRSILDSSASSLYDPSTDRLLFHCPHGAAARRRQGATYRSLPDPTRSGPAGPAGTCLERAATEAVLRDRSFWLRHTPQPCRGRLTRPKARSQKSEAMKLTLKTTWDVSSIHLIRPASPVVPPAFRPAVAD